MLFQPPAATDTLLLIFKEFTPDKDGSRTRDTVVEDEGGIFACCKARSHDCSPAAFLGRAWLGWMKHVSASFKRLLIL